MTNENGKELIVLEDDTLSLGKPYDRDLIVQFGETLMGIHPGAKEVGELGMRSVAQLALLTGANPLPGTNGIHAWKDNKGKVCVQFGIGFWRGEAEKAGGIIWVDRPRPMTDEEQVKYGINDNQIGAICKAALKSEVFGLMAECRKYGADMSLKDAKEEVARIGVGTATKNEYAKQGRPLLWSATERAERDLLRKLVPVLQRTLGRAANERRVSGGPDWSIGEFVRIEQEGEDIPLEELNDLLYDAPPESEEEIIEGVHEAETASESIEQPANAEVDKDFLNTTNWKQKAIKAPNFSAFAAAIVAANIGYNHSKHVEVALEKVALTYGETTNAELWDVLVARKEGDE